MKSISKSKRGILGLDTVKTVIVAILILAVTAIAVFAALVPMEEAAQTQFTTSDITPNETMTTVTNATNETVANNGLANFIMTPSSVVCVNSSGGGIVPTNNYTAFSDGNIISIAPACAGINGDTTGSGFCGWDWNCTYGYQYTSNNDAALITDNMTSGTTNFFSQVPTFMTLLGVVVLILIIAIVIIAVGKFEGNGFESRESGMGPGL